jgi:(2Fe-2S) ferredoxin
MKAPKHHFLICTSSRVSGEPNGNCLRRSAAGLLPYLQEQLDERGFEETLVTNTGCLKACTEGPVLVVYPGGHWYGKVTEDAIDTILDALERGEPAEDLLLNP